MNRRAILFMSDMFWFLIFVLCAFMLIVFLFYPLSKQIEHNKKGLSFETTSLYSDAQFYALTLSQQATNTQLYIHGNIFNYNGGSVADVVPIIIAEKKTDAFKAQNSAYNAYKKHLEDTFSRKEIWEVAKTDRNIVRQKWVPTTISVLITQGKTVVDMQCFNSPIVIHVIEETKTETDDYISTSNGRVIGTKCSSFVGDRDKHDSVESFQAELLSKVIRNQRVEAGWVHVPLLDSFVTFEVYIRYGLSDEVRA